MLIPKEDPMGKMLFVVFVLAIGLITFLAFMSLLSALMPRTRGRCKAALLASPWLSLLVGLVGYAALGGLAWWLYSGAFIKRLLTTDVVPGKLAGAIAATVVLTLVTFVGATGTVAWVGERLAAMAGGPVPPLRQVWWGTLAIVLAGWFPLGWVTVTPILLIISFGAALLAWRHQPAEE